MDEIRRAPGRRLAGLLCFTALLAAISGVRATETGESPVDPGEVAARVAAKLQQLLPNDKVVVRGGSLISIQTKDGRNVGATGVDGATLCAGTTDNCAAKIAEFASHTAEMFHPVAEAVRQRVGQPLLSQAVYAAGRLWLLADSGTLSSIAEAGSTRNPEPLPDAVAGLCAVDDAPVVVTCAREQCGTWMLQRRSGGEWQHIAAVARQYEDLVGFGCAAGRETLVTTGRLIEIEGPRQHSVQLSESLAPGTTAAVVSMPDAVLVGLNSGESGGGIRHIDRRSGRVAALEQFVPGESCRGPLSSGCDPVTALAVAPWNSGCIAATVGLVHLRAAHGRVVEVCRDTIRRLYFKPYGKPTSGDASTRGEPFNTVPFYGLARSGDDLWAVGIDALYRITSEGLAESRTLPEFRRIGDVSVSFAVPGLVLVMSDINNRRALGSSVPLLVAR